MAQFNIIQQDSTNRPSISDNQARLNTKRFVFPETAFIKDYYDPQGGTHSTITIKKVPTVAQLNFAGNPVTMGAEFEADDSYQLTFDLHDRYAIHNGVLYEFDKSIDSIIADYDAEGLKLISNVNGLLVFIDPSNHGDMQFVQGRGISNEALKTTFTVKSTTGQESRPKSFSLIPWENVNVKRNFILGGEVPEGENPITGFSIVGDVEKTATITLADGTELTATFTDNTSEDIEVNDLNIQEERKKIASVAGTELFETITSLGTPTIEGTILTFSFNNEEGVTQTVDIDLQSLIPEVSEGTSIETVDWNPSESHILEITESNGDTHTVDLSRYSVEATPNADGSVTISQDNNNKVIISKVGISNDYNDLDNKPDLNFESYSNWGLQVNGVDETEITSQEIVNFVAGNNIEIVKDGTTITFNSLLDGGDNEEPIEDTNNYITSISLNTETGLLTASREGLPSISTDLSYFKLGVTTNVDDTTSITQGGETILTISKVGVSNNYDDLDNKPALDFDNYSDWKLQVNGGEIDEITSQEVLQLIAGTNLEIIKEGNNITFNSLGGGGGDGNNNYVTSLTLDSETGVLTINRLGLPSLTTDLSEFKISVANNQDGSTTILQGEEEIVNISKVGSSNDYNDLDNITDQKLTIIKIPAHELSTVDKAGVTQWINNHGIDIDDKEFIAIEVTGIEEEEEETVSPPTQGGSGAIAMGEKVFLPVEGKEDTGGIFLRELSDEDVDKWEHKQDNLTPDDGSITIDEQCNIRVNVEGWDLATDFLNKLNH